ncbi:hypothetical protein HK101_008785 [Irineochytrium annulatum]|nr:hypothetical protein HK101_008785 [Irineochytrium annulatum]
MADNSNGCCYTADPTTQPAQMLLNITVKYQPSASASLYNASISFPSTYQMGAQPYRAPMGTVTCVSSLHPPLRTYTCIGTNSVDFFSIFNMITPSNANPRDGIALTLTDPNDSAMVLPCTLSTWCPDVNPPSVKSSLPMPIWEITTIAAGCGIALGGAGFIFAKYRTRAVRDTSGPTSNARGQIPNGGGGAGTLMAKVAAAQRARNDGGYEDLEGGGGRVQGDAAASLAAKMADARQRDAEASAGYQGGVALKGGNGQTLMEKAAEAKKLGGSRHELNAGANNNNNKGTRGSSTPNTYSPSNGSTVALDKSREKLKDDQPPRSPRGKAVGGSAPVSPATVRKTSMVGDESGRSNREQGGRERERDRPQNRTQGSRMQSSSHGNLTVDESGAGKHSDSKPRTRRGEDSDDDTPLTRSPAPRKGSSRGDEATRSPAPRKHSTRGDDDAPLSNEEARRKEGKSRKKERGDLGEREAVEGHRQESSSRPRNADAEARTGDDRSRSRRTGGDEGRTGSHRDGRPRSRSRSESRGQNGEESRSRRRQDD